MNHDRIHAQEPAHHPNHWSEGTVVSVADRDGHCVVRVRTVDGDSLDLVITHAIRELFVARLDIGDGDSPVGERVWYRRHGSRESE